MTWAGIGPSGTIWTINTGGGIQRVDWESAAGDVSGLIDNLIVIGLQSTPVSANVPASGFVLAFDGSSWTPQSPSVLGSGSTHKLLSTTHIDTIPGDPVQGDLVFASGSPSALWTKLPLGPSGYIPTSDGSVISWQPKVNGPTIVTAGATVNVEPETERLIINKTVGSATNVVLPGSPVNGETLLIKDGKGDAGTNNITITPTATTIDGLSTLLMTNNYQAFTLLYNGTEWNII